MAFNALSLSLSLSFRLLQVAKTCNTLLMQKRKITVQFGSTEVAHPRGAFAHMQAFITGTPVTIQSLEEQKLNLITCEQYYKLKLTIDLRKFVFEYCLSGLFMFILNNGRRKEDRIERKRAWFLCSELGRNKWRQKWGLPSGHQDNQCLQSEGIDKEK